MMKMGLPSRDGKLKAPCQEEEEEEEEEGLLKADAVNEEDPERDRTTGEASSQVSPGRARVMSVAYASQFA